MVLDVSCLILIRDLRRRKQLRGFFAGVHVNQTGSIEAAKLQQLVVINYITPGTCLHSGLANW
jgi:hypothetical protein